MKLFKRIALPVLAVILIMALGYKLRLSGFNSIPFPGESLDEYSNAWVGLSMIRLGVPVGMSGLPGYPVQDSRYINVDRVFQTTANGNTMQMSYPWFDHPPMMGLITGGFSYFKGARVFEDTTAVTIRKPVILMSTLTIGLAAYLAYLLFGWETAIAAATIIATSPLMVINSRMVQAENGLTPLFLLSLILLWWYEKKGGYTFLTLLSMTIGLAMLFKLSAVALLFCALALIFANVKKNSATRWQEGLIVSVIALSVFGIFVISALAWDFSTFVKVFLANSGRAYGIGLSALFDLITNTKITAVKFLTDGWPLTGWLGLAILTRMDLRNKAWYLWLPIFSYLAVYLFFGSEPFGWYRIPFLPFLLIVSGWLTTAFIRNMHLTAVSVVTLLIPLGINLEKYFDVHKLIWLIPAWRLSCLALIIGALSLLMTDQANPKVKWAVYATMFVLFSLVIYSNILRAGMFTVDYWYKVN
ncbi:MAG: hypothetical protein UW68_C0002G0055 [Candidatus Collierbacteria bacterium GW2011_GWB1_44_6]|uniref:Glycosyltransferase RgtA/B/C/D-like domain-containing protein n=2 Tax=Candidatus Collieribacteriota TaxID=1752725 RepID=A0A0G1JQI4_9BACT|nr:MAG: hypothetical protein UV68_C0003G0019 [Candidatus Collierbacteria bacterium GW2011_GWC2_43_12]KKT73786.1 MAG: hypothetical protein UW68_C0002G0055 [Candidatus Collierbacteria bacterium GW2011_GWB1_44_6]KKT83763.1 MAG: hypothetical protein UW80_C0007G0018 [Microgenomates group bacterium GW2011_GWC1_44_9]